MLWTCAASHEKVGYLSKETEEYSWCQSRRGFTTKSINMGTSKPERSKPRGWCLQMTSIKLRHERMFPRWVFQFRTHSMSPVSKQFQREIELVKGLERLTSVKAWSRSMYKSPKTRYPHWILICQEYSSNPVPNNKSPSSSFKTSSGSLAELLRPPKPSSSLIRLDFRRINLHY